MPSRTRYLRAGVSSPPPPSPPPSATTLDSDLAVILAALFCAIICVLGLVAVARCSWIRRFSRLAPTESPSPATANKGLKKKVLESLPKQTVGEADSAEKLSECAICLAEFAAGEEIRVLPQCGHSFHVGCIDTWLKSHSSCPSCRAILVVGRCKKCGSVPALSAGAQPELSQNHVDNFLPYSVI